MQRQIDMERSMMLAHRDFVSNMEDTVEMLEKDIREAAEMSKICTDEWCEATETVVDELHKLVYSLSEPAFATEEDSRRLRQLRRKIRDIYAQYKTAVPA